jgi:MEMO1 family protein
MIKSSYILPHSPILIPKIGKKNTSILKKTSESFEKIRQEIISDEIDTLIIISPHRKKTDNITINNHFSFIVNFQEFGDYSSELKLKGDLKLSHEIKESLETDFKPVLKAKEKPDYGANIPLYLLLSKNNQRIKEFRGKIVIINTSIKKDYVHHFEFGEKLRAILDKSKKSISIIASGELSHCLKYNAPGGFFQKAAHFDEEIIKNIKKGPSGKDAIIKTDPQLALKAKECGLRPILLLLGIMNKDEYRGETLSYQKDLGVGYLSMKINKDKNE